MTYNHDAMRFFTILKRLATTAGDRETASALSIYSVKVFATFAVVGVHLRPNQWFFVICLVSQSIHPNW